MSHLGAQIPDEASGSLLDDVRIASPCPAKWDEMIGDQRVRYCGQCTKNVYNLSAMPREEAEALLRGGLEREAQWGEGICVRIYRRADGTVLTADCPDGTRRKKRRLALFGAVGGGLLAAGAVGAELHGASLQQGNQPLPVHAMGEPTTMGSVAVSEPPPPPAPELVRTPQPPPLDPRAQGHWLGGAPVAGRLQLRNVPRR